MRGKRLKPVLKPGKNERKRLKPALKTGKKESKRG